MKQENFSLTEEEQNIFNNIVLNMVNTRDILEIRQSFLTSMPQLIPSQTIFFDINYHSYETHKINNLVPDEQNSTPSREYNEKYYRLDPYFFPLAKKTNSVVIKSTDFMDYVQLVKSKYYYDFLKPNDFYHVLIIKTRLIDNYFITIRFFRSKNQKDFSPKEIWIAKKILPFIDATLNSYCTYQQSLEEKNWAIASLNKIHTGICILDHHIFPIFSNQKAKEYYFLYPFIEEKTLDICSKLRNDIINHKIVNNQVTFNFNCLHNENKGCFEVNINVLYDEKEPTSATVKFLITIEPISTPKEKILNYLSSTYSLTPRQKEVLDLVLNGMGYQEIGEYLYIDEETVRTHVKNILKKIGIHNREELFSFILHT